MNEGAIVSELVTTNEAKYKLWQELRSVEGAINQMREDIKTLKKKRKLLKNEYEYLGYKCRELKNKKKGEI